jgi:hypothetical protein
MQDPDRRRPPDELTWRNVGKSQNPLNIEGTQRQTRENSRHYVHFGPQYAAEDNKWPTRSSRILARNCDFVLTKGLRTKNLWDIKKSALTSVLDWV